MKDVEYIPKKDLHVHVIMFDYCCNTAQLVIHVCIKCPIMCNSNWTFNEIIYMPWSAHQLLFSPQYICLVKSDFSW